MKSPSLRIFHNSNPPKLRGVWRQSAASRMKSSGTLSVTWRSTILGDGRWFEMMLIWWWWWDFRVIFHGGYGISWWFQGDFMVISCDFIVIFMWFHCDFMVIWWWFWDFVGILLGIYWYSIGFTYVIYWDFRGFGCDLLGFDGIDGNPLVFFNQCLWTGFWHCFGTSNTLIMFNIYIYVYVYVYGRLVEPAFSSTVSD